MRPALTGSLLPDFSRILLTCYPFVVVAVFCKMARVLLFLINKKVNEILFIMTNWLMRNVFIVRLTLDKKKSTGASQSFGARQDSGSASRLR